MIQILLSLVMLFSITTAFAKPLFPDSDTAKSEVELGVEGIQRLCPTGMWDHWTFRNILFDRDSNTVVLVVQLNSWSQRNEAKVKDATETQQLQHAKWIVSNFKAAYEELIKNPSIDCDGDFMLYLSLGALFKQIEKTDVKLRIMLLKPDYSNQVFGDLPLALSPEQLKEVKPKK